jgi:hypothetical protein
MPRVHNILGFRAATTRWSKPGDTIPFEMEVEIEGDARRVRAEVWTNANHNDRPDQYEAKPLDLVAVEGTRARFRGNIPIEHVGNYRAIGRVKTDTGETKWMGASGIADVCFRPFDESFDRLNIMEVNIGLANFNWRERKLGTLADMMENSTPLEPGGKYTLKWLKEQGINAILIQPVMEIEKWEHRPPQDDAGSPYAIKDFFSVRRELSRFAQGLDGDRARDNANGEFQAFMQMAKDYGIRVFLDIPLNHVGHNHVFRDLFVEHTPDGREVRRVELNNFSQVAINPEQLATIERRLQDPQVLKFMEYLAPHMYDREGSPHGARGLHDMHPGGVHWLDTKKLNHGGGHRGTSWDKNEEWWDWDPTASNMKVLGWLERIMRFWAVDMGISGFRFDHLTAMPTRFLEQAVNRVQADVDRHRPGETVFVLPEDFHRDARMKPWADAAQTGWFHALREVKRPSELRNILDDPAMKDILSLGNHDEERAVAWMHADFRATDRLFCALSLLGGPICQVMGAQLARWSDLPGDGRRVR